MKIGDLAVWTKYASEWSREPAMAGSLAGVVVRIIKSRRLGRFAGRRVALHGDGENFIVTSDMVEVINESQ